MPSLSKIQNGPSPLSNWSYQPTECLDKSPRMMYRIPKLGIFHEVASNLQPTQNNFWR